MILKGRSHVLGDDVNTDYIIAAKHRSLGLNFKEMAKHLLEDLDPTISGKIQEAGITAVLAVSYARIFYRNSFNVGLWLLECETREIGYQDEIELSLDTWVVRDLTRNLTLPIKPLPPFMLQILQDGGLIPHFKKWGGFHMME
jgi:3-isopropylmalate/(R)-2-methylmalate dehydratase small subunit